MQRRFFLAGMAALAAAAAQADARPKARPPRAPLSPEALIARADLGGQVGFVALDADSGAVIAARHADAAMPPASTLKIVTALFALDRLGADHRFATRVLRAGDDVILAGGGDPVLSTDDLGTLALATAAAWQGAPPKRFLVWGGALPRVAEVAPGQAVHLPYNPSISGMILNFNRVHLDWRRDKAGGYALALEARAARLSPRAYTISARDVDRAAPVFTYERRDAREVWTVARAAMGRGGSRWLPVRNPEGYAGDVFQTLARAEGLALPAPEVMAARPEGVELARHDSPPLATLLRDMLDYSTNLTAEVLGLAASGAGSVTASARAMQGWLLGQGVKGRFAFADHSGLSGDNAISPAELAQIVRLGQGAGLEAMLKPIPLRDAEGKKINRPVRISAKTGTLNFVSTLAGYAQGERRVIFAILTGDPARREAVAGQEAPAGVAPWVRRSKALQQALIEGWVTA